MNLELEAAKLIGEFYPFGSPTTRYKIQKCLYYETDNNLLKDYVRYILQPEMRDLYHPDYCLLFFEVIWKELDSLKLRLELLKLIPHKPYLIQQMEEQQSSAKGI